MNKLTQQQVFSLYLANPEQRVRYKNEKNTLKLYGVAIGDECILEHGVHSTGANISDCKLILKRISDMSEEHKVKFKRLIAKHSSKIWGWDDSQDIKKLTSTVQGISELMIFLIQNGYCIDESWITNGWVEVE